MENEVNFRFFLIKVKISRNEKMDLQAIVYKLEKEKLDLLKFNSLNFEC